MTELAPFNQRLYRTQAVREFDRIAIEEYDLPGITLMRRAAKAMLSAIRERWPEARRLLVCCGGGNNGGDGYLLAALARQAKLDPLIVSAKDPSKLRGDARRAWQFASEAGVECLSAELFLADNEGFERVDLIVDALLGIGLETNVRPLYGQLIDALNGSGLPIVAADVPSGVHSDTGAKMGAAVDANCTVAFVALKTGLATAAGKAHCGELVLSRLGIPDAVYEEAEPAVANLMSLSQLGELLPDRGADSHKGHYGHVMVVGGDHGFGGAAALAAGSAVYGGAGLVSLATRANHVPAAISLYPEVMSHAVSGRRDIQRLLDQVTVVVIGPGLGKATWAQQLLFTVLEIAAQTTSERRLTTIVFDADALNLLAEVDHLGAKLAACEVAKVFTPHPGEAARLLNCSVASVQGDRFAAARKLTELLGGSVLLKGAGSLVSNGDHAVNVCPYGNAGMASGGMGDVLGGLIGALCAQGLSAKNATRLATCIHSAAADQAVVSGAGPTGLHAGELLSTMRSLLNASTDEIRLIDDQLNRSVLEMPA